MIKQKVVLGVMILTTVALAIVPTSMRMRGLGPGLVGIVDDEYSDLFFNPAYINRIEGSRVYTNLSNIHSGGDALFFDPSYSPYLYYNLIGGITNYREMKIGGLLEIGGWNYEMTQDTFSIRRESGNRQYIDTIKTTTVNKNLGKAFNLIFGKKMEKFDVGLLIGPECFDTDASQKYEHIYYYRRNDSIIQYTYSQIEMLNENKGWMIPLTAGIIMGEPENEMAFSLGIGEGKADFLYSSLMKDIDSMISFKSEIFGKQEQKQNVNSTSFSLMGRNKRRSEEHSISYLAGLSYYTQPINVSMFDTSYSLFISPSSKEEASLVNTQKGDGSMNYLGFGFGVGSEKYFEAMGMKNLFAIGAIPTFFTSKTKIKLDPMKSETTYYDNYYPDTLGFQYKATFTNNETYDLKYSSCGFALSIPAGLETNLTERFVLRLGVTQDMVLKLKNTDEEVLTDAGWKYERDVTQGTSLRDTTITEPDNELDSWTTKTADKTKFETNTTYHYGLGFKVNDNIELNFLNFAQLTDLRTWVLGVNIKF